MRLCIVGSLIATGVSSRARGDGGNVFVLHDLHDFVRFSAPNDERAWMNKARSALGFDIMPGTQPLLGRDHSLYGITLNTPEPGSIAQPAATGVFSDPLDAVVRPSRNALLYAQREWSLRTDLYEAVVGQAATSTVPGSHSPVGTSRFNLRADLLVFRTPGVGMGRLTAQFRDTSVMPGGDTMQEAVGSVSQLDEVRGPVGPQLVRLAWSQSVFDDRLLLSVGKLNANDYVANNVFANDETRQYLAQSFDGNSTWPITFQNKCTGIGTIAIPVDWLFASGYAVSAASATNQGIDFSMNAGYAVAGEAGVLAAVDGRPVRLSWAWCGTNANATSINTGEPGAWGQAQAVTAQALVLPQIGLWSQWSQADASIASAATEEWAIGITIDDPFGRTGDGFGLAFALTDPLGAGNQHQRLTETYYRVQLTGSVQITLDAQVLAPSASTEVNDPTLVAGLRAVLRF